MELGKVLSMQLTINELYYVPGQAGTYKLTHFTGTEVHVHDVVTSKAFILDRKVFEQKYTPLVLETVAQRTVEPGSVVRLKSGSPPMTVHCITDTTVHVYYVTNFGKDVVRKALVPLCCLELVDAEDTTRQTPKLDTKS
jgi:hypothetical protein